MWPVAAGAPNFGDPLPETASPYLTTSGRDMLGGITGRRWTDEELAELKRLLDEGLPYPEIARRLGRSVTEVETMLSVQGWTFWRSGGRARREDLGAPG
jgi:hypothetical protein